MKALYLEYIGDSAIDSKSPIHSTRFKDRILKALPYLSAHHQGRDIFFTSEAEMGSVVYTAYESNEEDEVFTLLKCCKATRKGMFSHHVPFFTGNFDIDCQSKAIPQSLISTISLLLYGPRYSGPVTQEVLTISQLMFNIKKQSRSSIHRHSKTLETPFPLYVALLPHSEFRCKHLIQTLHRLGISVSYERILEMEKDILNASCTQYYRDGVVCPSQLRLGLPTFGTIDNIDINPKSNTSKESFHGTIISLFQTPKMPHTETKRPFLGIDKNNGHADLPADYAVVPAFLTKLTGEHPKDSNYTLPSNSSINEIVKGHDEWVNSAMDMFNAEETETCVTWKLFFRNKAKNSVNDTLPGISTILPLFYEKQC